MRNRLIPLALVPLALAGLAPLPALAQQAETETEESRPAPGVAGGHRKDAFIAAHDTDGDGQVTRAEYDAIRKARFEGADLDGDGVLNEEEYVAEFKGRLDQQYADQGLEPDERYEGSMEQAHVRFAIVDRSRNGELTWEEQQAVADSTFKGHDTDENDIVNADDPLPVEEEDEEGSEDASGDEQG